MIEAEIGVLRFGKYATQLRLAFSILLLCKRFRSPDEDPAVLSQRCVLRLRPLYIVALCRLLVLCCGRAQESRLSEELFYSQRSASFMQAGGESGGKSNRKIQW